MPRRKLINVADLDGITGLSPVFKNLLSIAIKNGKNVELYEDTVYKSGKHFTAILLNGCEVYSKRE
jgi:hypothetical protein